jgi:sugar/nucleoside kinase (ribokinase family)
MIAAGGDKVTLLEIRPASACRWDLVVLGEVAGTEYETARAAARSGLATGMVTAVADNHAGQVLADLLGDGGIGQAHTRRIDPARGRRIPRVAGSAASLLKPSDVPWSILFAAEGARWFHTGGTFAALSGTTPLAAAEAMRTARRCGTIVSYDLTCPPGRTHDVNADLACLADVLIGSEADHSALNHEILGPVLVAVIDDETDLSGAAGSVAGLFRDLLAGRAVRGLIERGALCATDGIALPDEAAGTSGSALIRLVRR